MKRHMPAQAPHLAVPEHDLGYGAMLAHQCRDRPKGERTSARIRIAACTLLQHHAPQDLTIPALCKTAGIAHGTFYLYFPDRTALLTDVLLGFVRFLQDTMHRAGSQKPEDTVRASTTAYAEMFEHNAGLMKCLLHHHDSFPQARAAFHALNSDWIGRVVTAVRKRLVAQGRGGDITQDELQRRAHALGGMVDQYFSALVLSADPALIAVSARRADVIDTLCLIWERGLEP